MPHVKANGLDLYYETHGPETAEPILLIMGLGAQMSRWSPDFIKKLVEAGHRVIAFDNRDVGLSEKLDAAVPVLRALRPSCASCRSSAPPPARKPRRPRLGTHRPTPRAGRSRTGRPLAARSGPPAPPAPSPRRRRRFAPSRPTSDWRVARRPAR